MSNKGKAADKAPTKLIFALDNKLKPLLDRYHAKTKEDVDGLFEEILSYACTSDHWAEHDSNGRMYLWEFAKQSATILKKLIEISMAAAEAEQTFFNSGGEA